VLTFEVVGDDYASALFELEVVGDTARVSVTPASRLRQDFDDQYNVSTMPLIKVFNTV
jgi:hypothetical protein